MGFMVLLIGIGGLAGAIELGENPTTAIVITILGAALLVIDCKLDDEKNHRHRRR